MRVAGCGLRNAECGLWAVRCAGCLMLAAYANCGYELLLLGLCAHIWWHCEFLCRIIALSPQSAPHSARAFINMQCLNGAEELSHARGVRSCHTWLMVDQWNRKAIPLMALEKMAQLALPINRLKYFDDLSGLSSCLQLSYKYAYCELKGNLVFLLGRNFIAGNENFAQHA